MERYRFHAEGGALGVNLQVSGVTQLPESEEGMGWRLDLTV